MATTMRRYTRHFCAAFAKSAARSVTWSRRCCDWAGQLELVRDRILAASFEHASRR